MPKWIRNHGWEDDKDRFLFTEREVWSMAATMFGIGGMTGIVMGVYIASHFY